MTSILSKELASYSSVIEKATQTELKKYIQTRAKEGSASQKKTHVEMLIDGLLVMRECEYSGKRDGVKEVSSLFEAEGYRCDNGYLVQCAMAAWYAKYGVDIFLLGAESKRRIMFRLLKMTSEGDIKWAKPRHQTIIDAILAGEHTHKKDGEDIKTELRHLANTKLASEIFRLKAKSLKKLGWNTKKLENMKEEQILASVKTWFKAVMEAGKDDSEEPDSYTNPVAIKIAQAINECIVPIATPEPATTEKVKAKKDKAMASV